MSFTLLLLIVDIDLYGLIQTLHIWQSFIELMQF